MINKIYSYIGVGIVFGFIGFLAPGQLFACAGGPCVPGDPGQGPQIYNNPQSGVIGMPTIYNPSSEAPYSAPIPVNNYNGPYAYPALPTIYGQNGQYGTNTTVTTTTAQTTNDNGSVFGNLFSNKKTAFSSANKTDITDDLYATVNSKGLALGTTSGNLCVKDNIQYIVLFKNITGQTLSNVAVRMYLPDEVSFRQTSLGNYSDYDHSVTAFLGTLVPGQTGQFIVEGIVVKTEIHSVARAEMVFTKVDGTQDMVVSYAFQNDSSCKGGSNLAGFAGGSGVFPTTLFGWLILSIILCAVLYFARFLRKKEKEAVHGHPVVAH